MPIRAYKIREISAECSFELTFDGFLFDILEELDLLDELNEGHGTMVITAENVAEMEKLLKEAKSYSEEEVRSVDRTIARIKGELDPKWGYAIYRCH